VCARVCVCVRVRGQRWPPAGASCSRARVRSSQALARSYPPTHLREASTRSRESQKGVRLRAHAPTDLGTQSAGPTQRAIIAADAAGPAALQSHRTGTVNGVPCGHAPAGRAGWSVCGKRASRGNLAIVRRPVGAAKMAGEKISSKKALWRCAGTLGLLVEPRVRAPHRHPLPKRTLSLGKPQFWRKSTEGTGRRLWCSRAGSRRGQHEHGPHPPLLKGLWVACAPCSALQGNRRRVSCAKAIATTRHKFPKKSPHSDVI